MFVADFLVKCYFIKKSLGYYYYYFSNSQRLLLLSCVLRFIRISEFILKKCFCKTRTAPCQLTHSALLCLVPFLGDNSSSPKSYLVFTFTKKILIYLIEFLKKFCIRQQILIIFLILNNTNLLWSDYLVSVERSVSFCRSIVFLFIGIVEELVVILQSKTNHDYNLYH